MDKPLLSSAKVMVEHLCLTGPEECYYVSHAGVTAKKTLGLLEDS